VAVTMLQYKHVVVTLYRAKLGLFIYTKVAILYRAKLGLVNNLFWIIDFVDISWYLLLAVEV